MNVEGFEITAVFYDDANFPHGFNRSGDFSILESDVLHQYGRAMKALSKEERKPVTSDEKRFVAVCKGERRAESLLERTWLKYLDKISNQVVISAFGSSAVVKEDTLKDPTKLDFEIDEV